MVQVNLGNDESWDTHENAFHNLKEYLLPPTDRAVSALLDDLDDRGMLDETLIIMAGSSAELHVSLPSMEPRAESLDGITGGRFKAYSLLAVELKEGMSLVHRIARVVIPR